MFMFGEHQQQDKFINLIANEISAISDSENIKFYYGETSAIFTFMSSDNITDIDNFLTTLFDSATNLVYILLPFSKDKMSVKLPEGIYEHIFDINNDKTISGFTPSEINLLCKEEEPKLDEINKINEEFDFIDLNQFNDEIFEYFHSHSDELNVKYKKPTIDDILDKISENGINSLTDNERNHLDEYSKTI
jgi:hypothetical protein